MRGRIPRAPVDWDPISEVGVANRYATHHASFDPATGVYGGKGRRHKKKGRPGSFLGTLQRAIRLPRMPSELPGGFQ